MGVHNDLLIANKNHRVLGTFVDETQIVRIKFEANLMIRSAK